MQQLALDSFRSGMRDRNLPPNTKGVWSGAAPIHSYVMPHSKSLAFSTSSVLDLLVQSRSPESIAISTWQHGHLVAG